MEVDRRKWLAMSVGTLGIAATTYAVVSGSLREETPPETDPNRSALRRRLTGNREKQLIRLKEYAEAERFPTNSVVKGVHPIFYDFQTGVACAVGHLMIRDGRREDVYSVARENNLVLVDEVRTGPVLDWILGAGLLQEECALIQPGYDWRRPEVHEVTGSIALIRMHLQNVHQFLSSKEQSEHSIALAASRYPGLG